MSCGFPLPTSPTLILRAKQRNKDKNWKKWEREFIRVQRGRMKERHLGVSGASIVTFLGDYLTTSVYDVFLSKGEEPLLAEY